MVHIKKNLKKINTLAMEFERLMRQVFEGDSLSIWCGKGRYVCEGPSSRLQA